MPRKFFSKYLPDPAKLREHRHLRPFSRWLSDPNLWSLNRRSVANGVLIGLFCGMLPIPHTLPAAMLAILFRGNLPISIALVWLNNPLTMVPIWYGSYLAGSWMLGTKPTWNGENLSFDAMWVVAWSNFGHIYLPLLVGTLVIGAALGTCGWFGVRIAWRLHVIRQWQARCARRKTTTTPPAP